MNNLLPDNAFTFSPPIDSQYLIELYAGDYEMIAETFSDVLQDYDGFVQQILSGYEQGDRIALKSAVHKIKPLFGFIGLLAVQAQCQDFENTCLQSDPTALAADFNLMKTSFLSVRSLIEREKTRLEAFNRG
jgi:HPt (histidine-containing phosphotransfer) domain-containing protein